MLEFRRIGSKCDLRCYNCGNEAWIMVLDGQFARRDLGDEPYCRLFGRWHGKPNVKQVLSVLEFRPEFKAAGFSALWRQAVANTEVDFGVYRVSIAERIAVELRLFGVETRHQLME